MARRRKNAGDDGFGLILVLLVMAFGVIVAIVTFLFQLAVTVAFYALPLAAGLTFLILREVGRTPPALLNPSRFDDAAASRRIAKLRGQQDYWARHHDDQYSCGSLEGLHLTKGSGETRFDTRSRLGRDLNANLDAAEAALLRIDREMRETRLRLGSGIPAWRTEFDGWTRRHAIKIATVQALAAFGIAALVLYVWALARPAAGHASQGVLLWNPLPQRMLISPLVGAALVAYATFGVMLKLNRRKLLGLVEGERAKAWRYIEAKWSVYTDPDDFFGLDRSDTPRDEAQSERRQEARQAAPEPPWYEVLGVSASAPEAQIKAAYREAIKGYHSDRVASLGPKLRLLAEEESKRINAAYDEARKVRQFR